MQESHGDDPVDECIPHHMVVTPSVGVLKVGEEIDFNAIVYDKYGNICDIFDVSWSINDSSIGLIDPITGIFFPHRPGTVQIIVKCYKIVVVIVVVVVKDCYNPCRIEIDPQCEVVCVGENITFKVKTYDGSGVGCETDCICSNLIWSVEDPLIGSITQDGVFTGIKPGETKVIVKCDDLVATACVVVIDCEECVITVTPPRVDFEYLSRCFKIEENYEERYDTRIVQVTCSRDDVFKIDSNVPWIRTNPRGFTGKEATIEVRVFPAYIPKWKGQPDDENKHLFTGILTISNEDGACREDIQVSVTTDVYYKVVACVGNRNITINGTTETVSAEEAPYLRNIEGEGGVDEEDRILVPLKHILERICYEYRLLDDGSGVEIIGDGKKVTFYFDRLSDDKDVITFSDPIRQSPTFDEIKGEAGGYRYPNSVDVKRISGYVDNPNGVIMVAGRFLTNFFKGNTIWNNPCATMEFWPGWNYDD